MPGQPESTSSKRGGDSYAERQSARNGAVPRRRSRLILLRSVAIFVVLMGGFYAFIHNPAVGPEPFQPYLGVLAEVTSGLVNFLGHESWVDESAVASSEFRMKIVRGCDAIEPTVAFLAAVLASPVALRAKVPGLLLGTLALVVLNLIRLVSLFFVGVYYPKALDFMHFDVWQAAFIVLAICCWGLWVQWATRSRQTDDAPVS